MRPKPYTLPQTMVHSSVGLIAPVFNYQVMGEAMRQILLWFSQGFTVGFRGLCLGLRDWD